MTKDFSTTFRVLRTNVRYFCYTLENIDKTLKYRIFFVIMTRLPFCNKGSVLIACKTISRRKEAPDE